MERHLITFLTRASGVQPRCSNCHFENYPESSGGEVESRVKPQQNNLAESPLSIVVLPVVLSVRAEVCDCDWIIQAKCSLFHNIKKV